jgi:glycerophosphoryl diester phosphodiesterase
MLVIGHRGAAGLAPENTMRALKAGFESGADILEFEIRLTRDHIPVLNHDATLLRTHKIDMTISSVTYADLKKAAGTHTPPTLDAVLQKYFGKILLNIELKSRGSGRIVAELLETYARTDPSRWDMALISSFQVTELIACHRRMPLANLALLQGINPFAFITYHRFLKFTAVGFHRLHINRLALEIAKKASIFTYVYTVNRPEAARRLAERGIEGIVTDRPDHFL